MSNPNQAQQNQGQNQSHQSQAPRTDRPTEKVRVRVKSGRLLLAHGTDEEGEDVFAETGAVVEVSRKFWDKHQASRRFDSYCLPNGGLADRPTFVTDMTLEFVEDVKAA